MPRERYDAIVVGSGATGSWVAKELTESGLDVALLDAGPLYEHLRSRTSTEPFARRYAVQSRMPLCSPQTQQLFVDDVDNPYTTPADRPFDWFRGRIVGGRLRTWGRVCLRLSDLELKAPEHDGHGVPWPIDHAELAPYYAEVERFMRVTGRPAAHPALPDGDFVAPVCEDCEGYQRLLSTAPNQLGHVVIPGRVALADGSEILAAALATGRLTLVPNAIVHRVLTEGGQATGVGYLDRRTHASTELHGRVVVLGASTIETTRVLLMSAPGGLGNGSGVLGCNLMDHLQVNASGVMPGVRPHHDGLDVSGRAYIPRFRNLVDRDPRFVRGYGFDANLQGSAFGAAGPGGAALFRIAAMGEMLPRADNRVTLDDTVRDAWGLPAARIDCTHGDNDRAMIADMTAKLVELVGVLGFEYAEPPQPTKLVPPGGSVHEVGTARMGADAATSYLDPHNRAWEVPNLYVVDGAAFPTIGWQNSTLTMMAIALRAARHIVAEGRRQNL